MPSAQTMLDAHKAIVNASRGAGLAGLTVQAAQAPAIKALGELVNADNDPRNDGRTE